MNTPLISTPEISARYRQKALDLPGRRLLMTNFARSQQQKDFSVPFNCEGFGRIHHFRRQGSEGWPSNPLPIDPARRALKLAAGNEMQAQVFQNAVCNWRCWYCFVDFALLSGNPDHSQWLSAEDLVGFYLGEAERAPVIDLSGGQPDLIPEWVPWMLQAVREAGLEETTYVWSDDNLSTDYFWHHLSPEQQELVASYPNYGRVCCFKGFDEPSFTFNTRADPQLWAKQFELMRRFVEAGIDVYGYVTLTTPSDYQIESQVTKFMDKLQAVHPRLPLRVIPLEIKSFSPVEARLQKAGETRRSAIQDALKFQWQAVECWKNELNARFDAGLRSLAVTEIRLD